MNCRIRLALLSALAVPLGAHAQRGLALLEELQAVYHPNMSMVADVAVLATLADDTPAFDQHGKILIDRDRFRFDSDTDMILRDREITTLFRRLENQVILTHAGESGGYSPSELLSDVDVLGVESAALNGQIHDGLRLAPRMSAMGIEVVIVWIRAADGVVTALDAHASAGTIIEVRFRSVDLAPTITDLAFEFTPPPDAEVVDMRF